MAWRISKSLLGGNSLRFGSPAIIEPNGYRPMLLGQLSKWTVEVDSSAVHSKVQIEGDLGWWWRRIHKKIIVSS